MAPVFVGLLFGVGVLLVASPIIGVPRLGMRTPRWLLTWRDLVTRSQLSGLTVGRLVGISVGAAFAAFIVVFVFTSVLVVSAMIALIVLPLPNLFVASQARTRVKESRGAWPEVIDSLVSGVRAGAGLPELLSDVGEEGPEPLRPAFRAFTADYQAQGRFDVALDRLKDRLADPIADRIIEALRLARDVGGADLSILLRDLGSLLREDARVRGELEARQSWTVNAARLAVIAPWIVLVMISAQPQAANVWNSAEGVTVLICGAAACIIAYLLMQYLGRLSTDPRTMR